MEGCIRQWISFVKPNFQRYVEPQRHTAGRNSSRNSKAKRLMRSMQISLYPGVSRIMSR